MTTTARRTKVRYRNPRYRQGEHYGPEHYETDVRAREHAGYLIYERIPDRCWDVVKDGVCLAQRAGFAGAVQAAEHLSRLSKGDPHPKVYDADEWLWQVRSAAGAVHTGRVLAVDPRNALTKALVSDTGMALVKDFDIPVDVLDEAPANFEPCYETTSAGNHLAVWLSKNAVFRRLDWLAAGVRQRMRFQHPGAPLPLGAEHIHMNDQETALRHKLVALLVRMGEPLDVADLDTASVIRSPHADVRPTTGRTPVEPGPVPDPARGPIYSRRCPAVQLDLFKQAD